VFGQLLSTHSVPSLIKVLEDAGEADMVRHEAAEALGGIATPEVLPHLKSWMSREDAPRVVRESCQVAIDMWEVRWVYFVVKYIGGALTPFAPGYTLQFENSGQFQYADGLGSVENDPVGA
jgi:deoxyhypusine monooxygenase